MHSWHEQVAAAAPVEREGETGGGARRPVVRAVRVVVPAHDEEAHVGACVASVLRAIETLERERPGVSARVVVVLDRCADRTAEVVAAYDVQVVTVSAGCVGGARRAGVGAVAAAADEAAEVLVVNTDADCEVPSRWLVEHLDLAATYDLVQGEVLPDPADLSAAALTLWRVHNPAGTGSLHGANLAFRLDAYFAVGGFEQVAEQEDLLLVRALKAAGYAAGCGGASVLTSGRRAGRVPGGFAGYLRDLDAQG